MDLPESLASVCLDPFETAAGLAARVAEGAFDPDALSVMAADDGTKATQALIRRAVAATR